MADIIDQRQARKIQKTWEYQTKVKAKVGRDVDVELTTSVNVGLCCLFCDNLVGSYVMYSKGILGIGRKRRWERRCKALNNQLLDDEYIESNFAPCKFELWESTIELDKALTVKFKDVQTGKLIDPEILSKKEFIKKKYGVEM